MFVFWYKIIYINIFFYLTTIGECLYDPNEFHGTAIRCLARREIHKFYWFSYSILVSTSGCLVLPQRDFYYLDPKCCKIIV